VKSYWEDVEDLLRTSWEHIGNNKIQHPHPAPAEKKIWAPGCMLPHLIACNKKVCFPLLFAIFGLG